MRARLLDLGDVGDVRSQSIYHAVTASMRPDDDPVVVLVRASTAFVSIGEQRDAAAEVDLDRCRQRRLQVVRRRGAGSAVLLDDNQLLFQVVLPAARAQAFGSPAELFAALARGPVAAYRHLGIDATCDADGIRVRGRAIGTLEMTDFGEGVCLSGSLAFDADVALKAEVLRGSGISAESETSIRQELADDPPGIEALAEALVGAFESCYGMELIPSMPTPDEMDAIHDWDERLLLPERAPALQTA